MFASEQLAANQKAQIFEALGGSKYASRSLGALAKIINESQGTTDDILTDMVGVEVHHAGSRSGKTYFTLAGGN